MTNPRPHVSRSGWVALLAATGVVLGGAYAVQRHRRKRDERRPEAIEAAHGQPADEPVVAKLGRPDVSRPPVRPGFIIALILVLALAAVTAVRLSNPDRTDLPAGWPRTDSPAIHPIDITPIRPR